ncbi:GntR family transcriptional regulator [Diaphorobacter sp.]|uniref:GntR family transcriptional regulator n=1 Tax=Diaphorobacter sp. TaxID=1934310 RepID=UPI0028A5A811|nr:GntR family transcriptional regulator [Diaphorobacter sp.]
MNTETEFSSNRLPNPAIVGGQPRYVQLAQTLLNEIESGKYPVGAQLPTEFELCEQFGVSRSTAREAVKKLVSLGLVVRQPRVGSTVCARSATTGYRQSIAEVSDLYQYATETTLHIESSETVQIDAQQARLVEGNAGEVWLHLKGRRRAPAAPEPICVTDLWLHPAFRSIQGLSGPLGGAVHAAIEQQFGEVIVSVEQEIRAVLLSDEQAQMLHVARGGAGLWVCRKYRNKLNQLVELAISIHPAESFSYSTVLRREWGVGAKAVTV